MAWRRGQKTPELWARGYLLLVAAFVAWTCLASIRDHYTVPFQDDWWILDGYFSRPFLAWAHGGGNGHRMPLTFALLALDYEWFGGRMRFLTLASLACALATLAALLLASRSARELPPALRAVLFGFSGYAIFWAHRSFNFRWAMNQGSVLTILWLTIAIAALARYATATSRGAGRAHPASLIVAALAAFLATFGHGMGAAAWVALLAMAVAARLPRRATAGLALAGVASVAAYLTGLDRSGTRVLAGFLSHPRPLEAVAFALTMIGTPPARIGQGLGLWPEAFVQPVATAWGAAGCVLAAAFAALRLRPGAPRPAASELVAVGWLAFALTGALLVAVARGPIFGAQPRIAWRFVCWSSLFWIGGAWALAAGASRVGRGHAVALALPALSVVMLFGLSVAEPLHGRHQSQLQTVALTLLMDVKSPTLWRRVSLAPPELVERVADRMRRDRRGLFADPRLGLVGEPLGRHFRGTPAGHCRGTMHRVRGLRRERLVSVMGRAREAASGRPLHSVVITDGRGTIRGLGEAIPAEAGRWRGYLAGDPGVGSHAAWGLLADGRVCLLASG